MDVAIQMEMQPTWPSLAAQLPLSAFMWAANLSLLAILTLRACSHASLGTHDTFSRISEVHGLQLLAQCVHGCPVTTKHFAAILDLVWNNIRITNFSTSSGHEMASSNSEGASGLHRLLQSIICRAHSLWGLVVRDSLHEETRRQEAPQRERHGRRLMQVLPK